MSRTDEDSKKAFQDIMRKANIKPMHADEDRFVINQHRHRNATADDHILHKRSGIMAERLASIIGPAYISCILSSLNH